MTSKHNDSTGHKRGARGFGKLDETDIEFLKPNFNDAKLYRATDGQEEVGSRAFTGHRYGVQGKNGEDR
jgi:hypothetical protein